MKEKSVFSRRDFLKAASVTALGGIMSAKSETVLSESSGGHIKKMERSITGDPYELLGKRLVFTNWFYIKPGHFGWYNDKGENVTVRGAEGPLDAHIRRHQVPYGIKISAQSANRMGPLLKKERPWEDPNRLELTTVLQEGDIYRAWGSENIYESKDGINWERPNVGIVERNGSRENNFVDLHVGNGTVFYDPNGPDSERYKWVKEASMSPEEFEAFKKERPDAWDPRSERPDAKLIMCVRGAYSPDGRRWTMIPRPLVVEHSDTQVTCYYDTVLRKYVMYTRNYMVGKRSEKTLDLGFRPWWDPGRRSIGRTESEDFRNFPLSELILEPSPSMAPHDLLYTNCRTTIPKAPDHHLMFPAIWHAAVDDSTSIMMASSWNGKIWNFLPGDPVFGTGAFGDFDGGCVFTRPNLIELKNGDWALPYTGYNVPHKYPRQQYTYNTGYAIWPKGRLVAVEAEERGEFTTVVIVAPGSKLKINALTQRAGKILVEVLDASNGVVKGRSIDDCIPIIGDNFWTTVKWKDGDTLGVEKGVPIALRFQIDRAKIFGLEFE